MRQAFAKYMAALAIVYAIFLAVVLICDSLGVFDIKHDEHDTTIEVHTPDHSYYFTTDTP